jgi:hypothetical protein
MWVPKGRPKFLYKYCSAPRAAQILSDLTFYYTPARALNDLYDLGAHAYREDAESKYRVFANRLIALGCHSDFTEAFAEAKSTSLSSVEETYSFFVEQLNTQLRALQSHSGVTCFTSERNNQRMWGTYGAEHSGAVLEFTTDPERARFAAHLNPIIYTAVKPPICPSALVTAEQELNQQMVVLLFSVKSLDWKEEREWRLLLLADHEQKTADRIIPFERSALMRVFIGPRISMENETSVREAASKLVPAVPVFSRLADTELAREEHVGIEEIHSFEQIEYWLRYMRRADVV